MVEANLDEVFRLVQEREGIDLRPYRRRTIERRVTSRWQKLRCQDYPDYVARLAADPSETRKLVEHVTIKVSRFFRNAPVFCHLQTRVLPELAERCRPGSELRLWSAGCGNGEEAYSLAILGRELAQVARVVPGVAVWGTDVDEEALAVARRGIYPETALAETSPEVIEEYFARQEGRLGPLYRVSAVARDGVRFLHHDLLSEDTAPGGGRFDLLLCRNVLIYFERPAQEHVFRLLAASLVPGGYLCLGEAEQLPSAHQSCFEIVSRAFRLYRRIGPE